MDCYGKHGLNGVQIVLNPHKWDTFDCGFANTNTKPAIPRTFKVLPLHQLNQMINKERINVIGFVVEANVLKQGNNGVLSRMTVVGTPAGPNVAFQLFVPNNSPWNAGQISGLNDNNVLIIINGLVWGKGVSAFQDSVVYVVKQPFRPNAEQLLEQVHAGCAIAGRSSQA